MKNLNFLVANSNYGVDEKKKKIRSRQKKLKAYDLSTLSEFLPEFSASQKSDLPAPDLKMNCKRRQELVYASIKILYCVAIFLQRK